MITPINRSVGRQVAVNGLEANGAPPPPPPGDVTFRQMTAVCPELESAIPPGCSTPASKALYVMSHHLLAKQLKGAPMTLALGKGGSVSLLATGALELRLGPGGAVLRLNNRHDDLGRLLDGAAKQSPEQPSPYVAASKIGLEATLSTAVAKYYANPSFDGGAEPKNTRGQNTFAYATMQQVLVSDDPTQRGLECLGSADFHLYKSMGLIPPELSREEVERRYTSIHGASTHPTPRLGPEFDLALRGIPSAKGFGPRDATEFANALRADDWAKLTLASHGTYAYQSLPSIGAVAAHLGRGGSAVHAAWADGGHHFVLSGASALSGHMSVNQDDSLRSEPPRRPANGEWPNRVAYDPSEHTRFWAIVR